MRDNTETIAFLEELERTRELPKLAKDSKGKIKVKQLSRNTRINVVQLVKKDIEFNLETEEGYLMFVGGILSKLVRVDKEFKQYFCINGKWAEI